MNPDPSGDDVDHGAPGLAGAPIRPFRRRAKSNTRENTDDTTCAGTGEYGRLTGLHELPTTPAISMPAPAQPKKSLGLFASGICVIALITSLGALDICLDYQRTIRTAYERLETLARIADESVSGRMRVINAMLEDVAREATDLNRPDAEDDFLAYMKARIASLEGIRTVSVTNAAGKMILSTMPEIQGIDAHLRAYFTQPLLSAVKDMLFLSGPIKAVTGTVVLFASRPRNPNRGHWEGVVVASIPPSYFRLLMETIRPNDGAGFIVLLGTDGTELARASGDAKEFSATIEAAANRSAQLALYPVGTSVSERISVEHRHDLVVYRKTEFSALLVAVALPLDQVLSEWRERSLFKGAALVLLAAIAIATLRQFARHEAELRREHNFAERVIETANVMAVGLDKEGNVQVFNGAAELFTGYSKNEIIGRPWAEITTTEPLDVATAAPFLANEPMPRHFDGAIRTKDGNIRHISWQNTAMDGPQIASMSFGLDMTDRLASEREAREAWHFIRSIADSIPNKVAYFDASLTCLFANTPFAEWFGRQPDDIVGRSAAELFADRQYAQGKPFIRRALTGERQDHEHSLTDAKGRTRQIWTHYIPDRKENGEVAGFFVVGADITPLKLKERELQDVSERLSIAARAGGFGVWSYELSTQRIFWDERMLQLYGLSAPPSDLSYSMWLSMCLPADQPKLKSALAAALAGRKETDIEFRIQTPAKDIRYIKAAAMLQYDHAGDPVRMVGINLDMTEIRENERALATAQVIAEQASHAKSEFLANMSHEIRTPLNGIMGLTHLLRRTNLSTDQRDLTSKITDAGSSLIAIINDILDFSRVEAGRLILETEEFELAGLMDSVSTIMSVHAADKELELVISADARMPSVFIGDVLRLKQVLLNFVSNAIKYTESGSVILRVRTTGERDGDTTLRFEVEDTGIGIASSILPSLFNAFTQADSSTTRRYGGSGLGLAISKGLVEAMGGEIGAESVEGKGSLFWFTVPIRVAVRPPPIAGRTDGGLEVVIADAHTISREALAQTAASLGWKSRTAASVTEMLERLRLSPAPDLLILDAKIPDADTASVIRTVRATEEGREIPVILITTTYSREHTPDLAGEDAADAVLIKPATASSLYNCSSEARAHRSGSPDPRIGEKMSRPSERRLKRASILVVEDNGINQEVARRVLELEGATVSLVCDGKEAVELLATGQERFDAVLMDIQMPVMDGYEATRRIRRDLGLTGLPIVALTAAALDLERARVLEAGMDDCITKPFHVDLMVTTLLRHMKRQVMGVAGPTSTPLPKTPAIVGIDMDQAMTRLGGDARLLVSLLALLKRQFSNIVAEVRCDLAAGQTSSALRRLHTLRGAAGNVAAMDVTVIAAAAEEAISGGGDKSVGAVLDELEERMRLLTQSISQESVIAHPEAPSAGGAPSPGLTELDMLLSELDAQNMKAASQFERMQNALTTAFGADFVSVMALHIEDLDFVAVAKLLRSRMHREG